jgi:hypothetical protein
VRLSENDIFILKHLTETINHLVEQIHQLEARIELFANKEDVEVVSSVPGVEAFCGCYFGGDW